MRSHIVCILIMIMVGCSSTPSGEPVEKTYKIAYNVLYDAENDDYEVFIMDIDGGNQRNLSNWEGVDWVYYAHEDRIFFISDRDTTHRYYFLYEMDPNGENVKKVSDLRLADSWMGSRFEGREMIVKSHQLVDSVFYVLNLEDGSSSRLVVDLPYYSDPLFSPDGDKIVFRGGERKSRREEGFDEELYMADASGNNLVQLTQYPKKDTMSAWFNYKAGPPRWNLREKFISYQSHQQGKYALYAVTPDGNRQWKLLNSNYGEGWHDWSSDGKWLAVELSDLKKDQFQIGLINWETKEMEILTDTTYTFQQAPVFVEIR